jgi:streptogramin lyase
MAGIVLSSMACGTSVKPSAGACVYTLDGVAVDALPANAYPSEWVDTKQEFRITLVDRATGVVSEAQVPDCKREEARRIIADRRAQDRGQSTSGTPIADRTYQ